MVQVYKEGYLEHMMAKVLEMIPCRITNYIRLTPTLKKVLLDIFIVLFVYNILRAVFHTTIGHLDNSIYFSSSFFLSSFKNISFLLLFGVVMLLLSYNYRIISWKKFSDYKVLKVLVFAIVFPIFWEQFFYDYNFYLNTDSFIDKGFLLLFMILLFIHPLFAFMVLTLGYIFFHSITFPFDSEGSHMPEFTAIYHILLLFVSFLMVKSIKKFNHIDTKLFIFLALTIHASNYFIPGVAKIEISPNGWEWAFTNEINNLFISAHINGWFGFLTEERSLQIVNYLNHIDILFTLSNMFIQLGAIFLLYNRRVSLWMFSIFELFHIGIMFMSGIIFWQWVILNLGFLYAIKHLSKENIKFLYNRKMFAVFVVIVALSPIIYRPFIFAWWDSNFNTIYDVYIVTDDNKSIKLNSQDISPYDEMFAQNALISFIDKEPTLINNRGILLKDINPYSNSFYLLLDYIKDENKEKSPFYNKSFIIYKALEKAESVDDVKRVLKEYGHSIYSEKKRKIFKEFLQTYFRNYNKKGQKSPFYKKFGAPYMLYDFTPSGLEKSPQVDHIEIFKSNIWYNKKTMTVVSFDHKKIMDIPIK